MHICLTSLIIGVVDMPPSKENPNMNIRTVTREEAQKQGYAVFNRCPHTLIDLSSMKEERDKHTLSVKLPNGDFVTFCVMPCLDGEGCIDIDYHGRKHTRAIAFENEKHESISGNLYSLDYSNEK